MVTAVRKDVMELFGDAHRCLVGVEGEDLDALEVLGEVFEEGNFVIFRAPGPRPTFSEVVVGGPYQRVEVFATHL